MTKISQSTVHCTCMHTIPVCVDGISTLQTAWRWGWWQRETRSERCQEEE